MKRNARPQIVAVERLSDGVMVKFADGTCVFYSAEVLYATVSQGQQQDEQTVAW